MTHPSFTTPAYARDLVSQEIALINAQAGIAASPLINAGQVFDNDIDAYKADYSQYIPRSHYTRYPELTAYFKAMMWYGQSTFRSAYEDTVKSALLQTSALQDAKLSASWTLIFEPTNFFVGECDDITWQQYTEAIKDVYGGDLGNLSDLNALTDPAAFRKAYEMIKNSPRQR